MALSRNRKKVDGKANFSHLEKKRKGKDPRTIGSSPAQKEMKYILHFVSPYRTQRSHIFHDRGFELLGTGRAPAILLRRKSNKRSEKAQEKVLRRRTCACDRCTNRISRNALVLKASMECLPNSY
ncbi:hypothetical protein AVEN_226831-1 [Araneus ventricosus]|uniref:Uncharacterized protein n=1 Tax=Araneus ventricosus TaxID=182803 RepID=A0A4Y2JPU4_ARAVE|nr:hypothetical protein AVEN_226831-1 [Araneus ventricosus]